MTHSFAQRLRRVLFFSHRWLGVATCLLCAMWLISGLVMLYVPFPSWRDDERTATLLPLDAGALNVAPGEALAKAALRRAPTVFRLEMYGAEPVYRIVDFGRPVSISAVDGRVISDVGREEAERRLQQTFAHTRLGYLGEVRYDQWTVSGLLSPHRPLHVFSLDDGRGTDIYMSSKTGEIVQATDARERFWNWLGAVPHWLYFTPLRIDSGTWVKVVQWSAGAAAVGAVLGIWIGIVRLRLRGGYASGRVSPYRGWLKWHHLTGLVGGVFLTVWLASGWLSVSSLPMFSSLTVGPDDLGRYYSAAVPKIETPLSVLRGMVRPGDREVLFTWVRDAPLAVVSDGETRRVYDARTGATEVLRPDQLVAAARFVLPQAEPATVERLDVPDAYWYSHHARRPLPALRIAFDDAPATWLMIDLESGRIVGAQSRADRIYRWLFNLVHQYDLPWLLDRPWARMSLIWLLSLLGIAISSTGAFLSWRVLRRR